MKYLFIIFMLAQANASFAMGLKNFRELFNFYSTATGVPTSDYNVRTVFNQVRANLPQTSDLQNYNAQTFLATSALSSVFCSQMVIREKKLPAANRRIHQNVDFTLMPAALSAGVINEVTIQYGQIFWGRTPSDAEMKTMNDLSQKLIATAPQSPSATSKFFAEMCSSIATSVEAVVLVD